MILVIVILFFLVFGCLTVILFNSQIVSKFTGKGQIELALLKLDFKSSKHRNF